MKVTPRELEMLAARNNMMEGKMAKADCPLCEGTGKYIAHDGRERVCTCPFDMRPLSKADMQRTVELARQYGWRSR